MSKVSQSAGNNANGTSATNSSDIYNIVLLVVDIVLLLVKFWLAIVESIVGLFQTKVQENVSGKFVLITGAGHGMGKQMALQYAALGATVICWDVNEQTNNQTVKDIKQKGGKAFGYVCNVTKREELIELAQKVRKEHGFIHVVVNNAGIMPCHPLLEHTENEIRLMYDINVISHFWMIQSFLPEMIERNEGSIVALSSCAGLFGLINLVPYCGTKFAVRGYMAALAEELRQKNPQNNVKLTTIYPYMIDTGLCKNPRYRFPSLFQLISPDVAAASIIQAQREGLEEAAIPRSYLALEKIGRLVPRKAMRLVNDFVDTGVDTDKH
ncbi:17-beta-hydroxysteroid dehydrogenase 13 [Drosophila subobscura]|uniref:17-beta-hydroxysteroid dehydrogenase 13 n=1 Tax=Drosophila subobscura TaxID=7241 RepID=UPI00155A7F18|nr:17-beta-hydroxysteroid dehydrogenase 13 [Drosophila subobscura]XP_034670922.1 17-beta-hydroxysteroid dehydrogenase 13 [Drosophila subobscura]